MDIIENRLKWAKFLQEPEWLEGPNTPFLTKEEYEATFTNVS